MDFNQVFGVKKYYFFIFIGLILIIIFSGYYFSFFYVTDYIHNKYKNELLDFAQLVSVSIDPIKLKNLSATTADYDNEEFQKLSAKFTKMAEIHEFIRYIYIVGEDNNKQLFFYLDTQPEIFNHDSTSPPLAIPGEIYDEADVYFYDSIRNKKTIVFGPIRDKWGEFISASIPLINPNTGEVIAILGVDMESSFLFYRVWSNRLMIFSLMILLLIIVILWFLFLRHRSLTLLKLNLEKQKLQKYLDLAPALIIGLDKFGKITMINRAGCSILEGTEKEIIGRNWFETFLSAKQVKSIKKFFNEIINEDFSSLDKQSVEGEIVTLNGKRKVILWNNNVLKDSLGNVVEVISFGQDISNNKLIEQDLLKRNQQLKKMNQLMVSRELEMKKLKENRKNV